MASRGTLDPVDCVAQNATSTDCEDRDIPNMDSYLDNERNLWECQEENFIQGDSRNDLSNYLWNEIKGNEDDLLCMLGEYTPSKDCAEFDSLVSGSGEKGKDGIDEFAISSQQKRRRMLQFKSDDADSISVELSSIFLKSKIDDSFVKDGVTNEKMNWAPGFLDWQEGLDQSSEHWVASCLNETDIHLSADKMISCGPSDDRADTSERCNIIHNKKTAVRAPAIVSTTHCSKFRGQESYIRTPTKMTFSVAYPFALIKPCGIEGDVTLKDINKKIHSPVPLKTQEPVNEDSSDCCPISAISGQPVVVKTKIRTEGGRGSVTIMRTRG